jgi:hypothetical protein
MTKKFTKKGCTGILIRKRCIGAPHGRKYGTHSGNMKEIYFLEEGIDGRMILKWILNRMGGWGLLALVTKHLVP